VSQKYRLSLKVRHLEVLWSTEKWFKKFNIYQMGKILKIYFNKIIFVEVFGCCFTSQAHQNGRLGIQ
jgi:hypothetical protein